MLNRNLPIFILVCFISFSSFATDEKKTCQVELSGEYGKNAQGFKITQKGEDYNNLSVRSDGYLTESECDSFCDSYEGREFKDVRVKYSSKSPLKVTKRFYIKDVEGCDWGFWAWF